MIAALSYFFDPSNSPSKMETCRSFLNSMEKAPIDLFMAELAYGDTEFNFHSQGRRKVCHFRTDQLLFNNERLFNVLIQKLPSCYEHVVWIDSNVIYLDSDWPSRIEDALKSHPMVQPYSHWVHLPASTISEGDFISRFSQTYGAISNSYGLMFHRTGKSKLDLGNPGCVWAIRREIVERHGFYDAMVSGDGEWLMIIAALGILGFFDVHPSLSNMNERFSDHYFAWAIEFYRDIKADIGFTDDLIIELGHVGTDRPTAVNRATRMKPLIDHDFDPLEDIAIAESGCWSWNSPKTEMHQAFEKLFLGPEKPDTADGGLYNI